MGRVTIRLHDIAAIMTRSFLGLVAAGLLSLPVRADDATLVAAPPAQQAPIAAQAPRRAEFLGQAAPDAVQHMADWVADSRDNGILPFVIIDKTAAKAFVFDQNGRLLGAAWVLVGLARGDDSAPGIGTMPLAKITPDLRTTPAGRFVAALGNDLGKFNVLWVDYPNAISLHRVINTKPAERRLKRIVSPAPGDHRISYGCINVPAKFFDSVVEPAFQGTKGIVYILPEVKTMRAVFPAYHEGAENSVLQAQAARPASAAPVNYQNTASVEDHDLPGVIH